MSKEYYIGDSDFWGNNSPNDKFNKELVPLLKKLGVKSDTDLDKIANIVKDISSMSYENGYDNCEKENQEYLQVMEHKNILSYIAKDIQKTCERLGIYAEFTPKDEKHIVSSDFKMEPAIFKSIHVEADLHIHPSEVSGEDDVLDIDVSLHYRYYHWEGGENGCNIGWMKYQIQQAFFNKDKVYIDNFESLCTIKRWRGIEL